MHESTRRNQFILASDLATIAGTGWLSLCVLTGITEILNRDSEDTAALILNNVVLVEEDDLSEYVNSTIRCGVKYVILFANVGKTKKDEVFIGKPGQQGSHWTLLYINLTVNEWYYIDTFCWGMPTNLKTTVSSFVTAIYQQGDMAPKPVSGIVQAHIQSLGLSYSCSKASLKNIPPQTCANVCGVAVAVLGGIASAAPELWRNVFLTRNTDCPTSLKWLLRPPVYSDFLRCSIICWLLTDSIDVSTLGIRNEQAKPLQQGRHCSFRPRFLGEVIIPDDEREKENKDDTDLKLNSKPYPHDDHSGIEKHVDGWIIVQYRCGRRKKEDRRKIGRTSDEDVCGSKQGSVRDEIAGDEDKNQNHCGDRKLKQEDKSTAFKETDRVSKHLHNVPMQGVRNSTADNKRETDEADRGVVYSLNLENQSQLQETDDEMAETESTVGDGIFQNDKEDCSSLSGNHGSLGDVPIQVRGEEDETSVNHISLNDNHAGLIDGSESPRFGVMQEEAKKGKDVGNDGKRNVEMESDVFFVGQKFHTLEELETATKMYEDSHFYVVVDEDNNFKGLFYQDAHMRNIYSHFPEILLVATTYKLLDLRMPVYLLICIDGNGLSEVVAMFIVSEETREVIKATVELFKKHNPSWDKTKVVMSDKDFTERDVFKACFRAASLNICLNHTMRSFRREMTCEKMGITSAERLRVLELLSSLAYFKSVAFDESLVHKRWKMDFYFTTNRLSPALPILLDHKPEHHVEYVPVHEEERCTLTQSQKFKKGLKIAQVLASLVSEGGMSTFKRRYEVLDSLVKNWKHDHEVNVQKVGRETATRKDTTAEEPLELVKENKQTGNANEGEL
ncbi:Zinc finger SWIM domain-containing protein 1 [Stylophora pistillata]|uniref:Zinc finger SWIM domain-containing protein 1 n=1 Tax=Stylophora pistillata TaxID=50429 RepID=A0A2B4R4Y8_STYPI|nr:Zinc finger SWIM domain-containing protein 1 [Stylophora pistillata]